MEKVPKNTRNVMETDCKVDLVRSICPKKKLWLLIFKAHTFKNGQIETEAAIFSRKSLVKNNWKL